MARKARYTKIIKKFSKELNEKKIDRILKRAVRNQDLANELFAYCQKDVNLLEKVVDAVSKSKTIWNTPKNTTLFVLKMQNCLSPRYNNPLFNDVEQFDAEQFLENGRQCILDNKKLQQLYSKMDINISEKQKEKLSKKMMKDPVLGANFLFICHKSPKICQKTMQHLANSDYLDGTNLQVLSNAYDYGINYTKQFDDATRVIEQLNNEVLQSLEEQQQYLSSYLSEPQLHSQGQVKEKSNAQMNDNAYNLERRELNNNVLYNLTYGRGTQRFA